MEKNSGDDNIFEKLSKAGKAVKETADSARKAAADAGITGESLLDTAKKVTGTVVKVGGEAVRVGEKAVEVTQEAYQRTIGTAVQKLDRNGDGKVDIEDVIIVSLRIPGVHIDRARFLEKELFKNHPREVVDKAIAETPAKAGIPREEIDKIADEVINFERSCVSGISAALGIPGGAVMAATIPADILQYYGYTLRAAQKLLYLYGFPEIDSCENDLYLDTETINTLILCLGVMYGTASANNAIRAMAKALATGVEKQLMKNALTRGAFFKFVQQVGKWFGKTIYKKTFAGFFKKAIPVVGGVIGGGVTFLTFKPCCNRLKHVLEDTLLSNPDHVSDAEEDAILESILTDNDIRE